MLAYSNVQCKIATVATIPYLNKNELEFQWGLNVMWIRYTVIISNYSLPSFIAGVRFHPRDT